MAVKGFKILLQFSFCPRPTTCKDLTGSTWGAEISSFQQILPKPSPAPNSVPGVRAPSADCPRMQSQQGASPFGFVEWVSSTQ